MNTRLTWTSRKKGPGPDRQSDEELAAAVVALIKQPELAARLARQGREAVERRYAWDANLPRLDAWLERLASLPRRPEENQ